MVLFNLYNIGDFSRGEKRILSIIRTLLSDSDVMFFDDPTSPLDQ